MTAQLGHLILVAQLGHLILVAQLGHLISVAQLGHLILVAQLGHLILVAQLGHLLLVAQLGELLLVAKLGHSIYSRSHLAIRAGGARGLCRRGHAHSLRPSCFYSEPSQAHAYGFDSTPFHLDHGSARACVQSGPIFLLP